MQTAISDHDGSPEVGGVRGALGYDRVATGGVLAQLRIRKKLILLHTVFSLALATALLVLMGPALEAVVAAAERGAEGVRVENPSVREAVKNVYLLLVAAVVGTYVLIAVALEVFVLPRHVYAPIRLMLRAERAVQEDDFERELIPESAMPADELGEIMRSRNDSIRALRRHETDLAEALDRLETVAGDLKRKNHLLENTRRNLEGADRLASLGMMSAGIAHELNTPLAVATGLVEKLRVSRDRTLSETEAALLGRVMGRLERLSDSLLDFARARSPEVTAASLGKIVEEAITLARLDRGGDGIAITNTTPHDLELECEADRMVQVFVNLVRNALDAMIARPDMPDRSLEVSARAEEREGVAWVIAEIRDTGPGIEPEVLPTLFEPFVSTRLDAKGTGLGLAVADGIVQEHGGTLIARNRKDRQGAAFEIVLPRRQRAGCVSGDGPESGDGS